MQEEVELLGTKLVELKDESGNQFMDDSINIRVITSDYTDSIGVVNFIFKLSRTDAIREEQLYWIATRDQKQ